MKAGYERVDLSGDRLFHRREVAVAAFRVPYHFHPELELTYILQSAGERMVGDGITSFGPDDLVLLGPDLPHLYLSAGGRHGPTWARALVVQFRADFLGPLFAGSEEGRRLAELAARARRGLWFAPATARRVRPKLEALFRAEGLEGLGLLLQLLGELSGAPAKPIASPGYAPDLREAEGERIDRVCRFLRGAFREEIGLAQAAGRAHLSVGAFSRLFRRATGRTFTRFVNELRVAHACRLLVETQETVAAVALDAGYRNLANFNRRFLEIKGETPRVYRARVRKIGER